MDSIWSSQPSNLGAIDNSPDDNMSLPFDQVPIDPVLQAWDNDQPSTSSVQTTFFNMASSNSTINTAYSHNNGYPCSVRTATVSPSHSPTISWFQQLYRPKKSLQAPLPPKNLPNIKKRHLELSLRYGSLPLPWVTKLRTRSSGFSISRILRNI